MTTININPTSCKTDEERNSFKKYNSTALSALAYHAKMANNISDGYIPYFPDTSIEVRLSNSTSKEELELMMKEIEADPNIISILLDNKLKKSDKTPIIINFLVRIKEISDTRKEFATDLVYVLFHKKTPLSRTQIASMEKLVPSIINQKKYMDFMKANSLKDPNIDQKFFDGIETRTIEKLKQRGVNIPDKYKASAKTGKMATPSIHILQLYQGKHCQP